MPKALLGATLIVAPALMLSSVAPFNRLVWWLEALPVLVVFPLLYATARRYPLSSLLYWLIAAHSLVLLLGAHYSYARVPAGFWLQDWLELSRNHYDRFGHFAQGFIPAIAVREILKRSSPLKTGPWLPVLTVATCLAISACYEFVEWWVAVAAGIAAEDFLATQGDVWDTQWDMFLATCGAIVSLALLSGVHDRSLRRVPGVAHA